MNEVKVSGTNYGDVAPDLVGKVRNVISEADKHRYSVSAVYSAYNTALNKKDVPQSCGSCLRNRVRELRRWLDGYEAFQKKKEAKKADPVPEADNGKEEGIKSPEQPENGQNEECAGAPEQPVSDTSVLHLSTPDGKSFDFTADPENPNKGRVTRSDGTSVKPGTYITVAGVIAVQPGGKATIKETSNPEEDLL